MKLSWRPYQKKIINKAREVINKYNFDYPEDIRRIVNVAMVNGLSIHPLEAERLWSEHSYKYAAGWLHLSDSDDEILSAINWWQSQGE